MSYAAREIHTNAPFLQLPVVIVVTVTLPLKHGVVIRVECAVVTCVVRERERAAGARSRPFRDCHSDVACPPRPVIVSGQRRQGGHGQFDGGDAWPRGGRVERHAVGLLAQVDGRRRHHQQRRNLRLRLGHR